MVNQKIYKLNATKMIELTYQYSLLLPNAFKAIKSFVAPLVTLNGYFNLYRKQTYFEIETNGQVCKLRGGLNTKFDYTLRRIYITDGVGGTIRRAYKENENKPLYLPTYLQVSGTDFIVNIPVELSPLETDIKLFLNKFKLPTKTYQIIYF